MKHMTFEQSEVLREFSRIMEEKDGIKKIAQAQLATPDGDKQSAYYNKLLDLQTRAQAPNPTNDPKLLISRRDLQHLAELGRAVGGTVAQESMGPLQEYDAGKNPKPILLGLKSHSATEGLVPAPKTIEAAMQKQQSLSRRKVADQKAYDVTPKEDMIAEAHPKPAIVCGDELVENKNEQSEADIAIAQKSAQTKQVLAALYKLAKRLQSEKNDKAYKLVKATCLEISKTIKK